MSQSLFQTTVVADWLHSETLRLAESVLFIMMKASKLFEEIVQKALFIHSFIPHDSVNLS